MYHLAANDNWFNGMSFDSLAAAVAKQAIASSKGITCDVMRHEDTKTTKVVNCGLNASCNTLERLAR